MRTARTVMVTGWTTNRPTGLPIPAMIVPAMIAVVVGEASDPAVMRAEETRVRTGADSSVAGRRQVRDRRDRMRMAAAILRMILGNRVSMTTTTRARNMALHRLIRLMIRERHVACVRPHDVGQTRDLEIRRMLADRSGHPPTLHATAAATRVAIVDVVATGQMV